MKAYQLVGWPLGDLDRRDAVLLTDAALTSCHAIKRASRSTARTRPMRVSERARSTGAP
jgi:hypothetical protein